MCAARECLPGRASYSHPPELHIRWGGGAERGARPCRLLPDAAEENQSTPANLARHLWDCGELVATQKPFMNNDKWRTSHNANRCSQQQHPF